MAIISHPFGTGGVISVKCATVRISEKVPQVNTLQEHEMCLKDDFLSMPLFNFSKIIRLLYYQVEMCKVVHGTDGTTVAPNAATFNCQKLHSEFISALLA